MCLPGGNQAAGQPSTPAGNAASAAGAAASGFAVLGPIGAAAAAAAQLLGQYMQKQAAESYYEKNARRAVRVAGSQSRGALTEFGLTEIRALQEMDRVDRAAGEAAARASLAAAESGTAGGSVREQLVGVERARLGAIQGLERNLDLARLETRRTLIGIKSNARAAIEAGKNPVGDTSLLSAGSTLAKGFLDKRMIEEGIY